MSKPDWKAGDVIENAYPFVRSTYFELDEDGGSETDTWRPGCDYEASEPYGEYKFPVIDGMGKQILTVVDVHKPGRFPTRVFYTCKWVTPEGKTFGKGGLKITTVDAFTRRARGFMSWDREFQESIRERSHD